MRPGRDAGIRAETQQLRNAFDKRLGQASTNGLPKWPSAQWPSARWQSAGPWPKFPCRFPNSCPWPQQRPANQISHRERFDILLALNVFENCGGPYQRRRGRARLLTSPDKVLPRPSGVGVVRSTSTHSSLWPPQQGSGFIGPEQGLAALAPPTRRVASANLHPARLAEVPTLEIDIAAGPCKSLTSQP